VPHNHERVKTNSASVSDVGKSKMQKVTSAKNMETAFAKISILNSVESESVFKRNKLMLEHVMLDRAIQRLNSRKEKREEKLLKGQEPPT